jgi:hypothetical protein
MRSPAPALSLVFASLVSVLALAGCGHPATRAECDELFDRTARIELDAQHVKDPAVLEKRIAEAREQSGGAFEKSCLSKKITNTALACVRKASTSEQFDKCLD